MTLIQNPHIHRPMFQDATTNPPLSVSVGKASAASFHDILSPEHLTTASPTSEKPPSPNARFKDVVRRAAMPKMQGVAQSIMRRSGTVSDRGRSEKYRDSDADSMKEKLLPQGSLRRSLTSRPARQEDTASLRRSVSSASSRSTASTRSSMSMSSARAVRESNSYLPSLPSVPANAPLQTSAAHASRSSTPPVPPQKERRVPTLA
ncbi:hypothetical protein HGRIS_012499 [Hohenbuehelia grisea]|uniref:Uncharacterized protein n=1 Tax=Hohenbuehelia grisea TaxID=104357 RepID=A0ABR3ISN4_9AGAR